MCVATDSVRCIPNYALISHRVRVTRIKVSAVIEIDTHRLLIPVVAIESSERCKVTLCTETAAESGVSS
jgi:hypothetical protein